MRARAILTREALTQPARTHISQEDQENYQFRILSQALKETLKRELLAEKQKENISIQLQNSKFGQPHQILGLSISKCE
jgi:hypothetical protein